MSLVFEAHKKIAADLQELGFKVYHMDETTHPAAYAASNIQMYFEAPDENPTLSLEEAFNKKGYRHHSEQKLEDPDWRGQACTLHTPYLTIPISGIVWLPYNDTPGDRYAEINHLDTAISEGWGAELLEAWRDMDVLQRFFPELHACINVEGGDGHAEDVYTHLISALKLGTYREMRYAALFHDIGKPLVKKVDKNGKVSFHRHEIASKRILENIINEYDLGYLFEAPILVEHHMFYFDNQASDKAVRHWLAKVGKDIWEDLFELRAIDRQANMAKMAAGKPAVSSEMKNLKKRINRLIKKGPVFKEDLEIERKDIFKLADLNNLTEVACEEIFSNLLGLVDKDPEKNNREYLQDYVRKVYGPKPSED